MQGNWTISSNIISASWSLEKEQMSWMTRLEEEISHMSCSSVTYVYNIRLDRSLLLYEYFPNFLFMKHLSLTEGTFPKQGRRLDSQAT